MLTRSVKPLQGAAMLALSALLFSLMGVAIREVSVSVNNESVVFFRNLVGVVFFLPLVLIKGFQPLRTQRLKSHLWRTTYGLAAMYCFFYAIAHLPLADAMLFTYSAPVFTPIIAWWLLKESLSKRMLIATCIGLTGVLLVAKPSAALLDSQASRIGKVIDTLRQRFNQPLRIKELADVAHLSESALFQAFKAVTSMSPLQFQKQLRLNEARRIMLYEGLEAATASYKVGYESPSQFSREYSRLFGAPPLRDLARLRMTV